MDNKIIPSIKKSLASTDYISTSYISTAIVLVMIDNATLLYD